jgi:hypothetical protein
MLNSDLTDRISNRNNKKNENEKKVIEGMFDCVEFNNFFNNTIAGTSSLFIQFMLYYSKCNFYTQ